MHFPWSKMLFKHSRLLHSGFSIDKYRFNASLDEQPIRSGSATSLLPSSPYLVSDVTADWWARHKYILPAAAPQGSVIQELWAVRWCHSELVTASHTHVTHLKFGEAEVTNICTLLTSDRAALKNRTMTAKTLEKAPVALGGFVHPLSESIYSVDEIATSLPAVTIFPNGDLGGHYEQINGTSGGKKDARVSPVLITC